MEKLMTTATEEYKEFSIECTTTKMGNNRWKVHIEVWFKGSKHVDKQNLDADFSTSAEAETAGMAYGRKSAERWRKKTEAKFLPEGTVVIVGGLLYQFPTVGEAAAARQWLIDNDATDEQFAEKFGSFYVPLPSNGYNF